MLYFRCNFFCNDVLCGKWRNRWFFVKETCFGYIRPKDGQVKCIILFDQGFEISSGMYSTGMHHGLQIKTMSRQLVIKCWTRRKGREWMQYLKDVANHQGLISFLLFLHFLIQETNFWCFEIFFRAETNRLFPYCCLSICLYLCACLCLL